MAATRSPQAALAALLVLGLTLAPCPAAAVKGLSGWNSGFITLFGGAQDGMSPDQPSFGTLNGACAYGTIPKDAWPYFSTAALSPSNPFAQGAVKGCGTCYQIQCESSMDGNKGICIPDSQGKPRSIMVVITDVCPECGTDHIDVQALAFAKIANPGLGRVKVTYRRVECTPPGNLAVSVMDFAGSNGWLRLAIDDTGGRGAIQAVFVKSSSAASWVPMTNTFGAAWELSRAPAPPLDFKFVDDAGQEVIASGVIKQNGGISGGIASPVKFTTGSQFSITDPAVMTVQAFGGPSDPMLITSDTPGNGGSAGGGNSSSSNQGAGGEPRLSADGGPASSGSAASANASSSNGGSCVDVPPPGAYSCQQQKDWGKCGDAFIVQGNYCRATCGRCGGGSSGGSASAPSSSSPAPSSGSPAPSTGSPAPAPAPSCTDVPSPGFTCQQQKSFGKCNDAFMVSGNYCAATCGRCGGGGGQAPQVQAAARPPSGAGGRKLLRRLQSRQ